MSIAFYNLDRESFPEVWEVLREMGLGGSTSSGILGRHKENQWWCIRIDPDGIDKRMHYITRPRRIGLADIKKVYSTYSIVVDLYIDYEEWKSVIVGGKR